MAEPREPLAVVAARAIEQTAPLTEAVFGTTDADDVVLALEGFCAAHLGADPISCSFWEAEIGLTLGLEVDDGTQVVLRCHPPEVGREHLGAVAAVRRHLFSARFPVPELLAGPHHLGRGFATAESFVRPPPAIDMRPQDRRSLLARGLCRLNLAASQAPGKEALATFVPDSDGLDSSEAIDDLVGLAGERMVDDGTPSESVATHLDWCADHVRVDGGAIRMILGWNALYSAREPVAIGWISARFLGSIGGAEGVRPYPTPDESDAFIAAYSSLRKTPWGDSERKTVGAARAFSLADAARRELTLGVKSGAEEMLLRFGERYLVVRS